MKLSRALSALKQEAPLQIQPAPSAAAEKPVPVKAAAKKEAAPKAAKKTESAKGAGEKKDKAKAKPKAKKE